MSEPDWSNIKEVDPYADDEKPRPDEWSGEKPTDSRGNEYNPYAGSQHPPEYRCGATLVYWRERYNEKRYCTQVPQKYFGKDSRNSDFCKLHQSREELMKRAKEILSHGGFTKTVWHLFDKLEPYELIYGVGVYEEFLGDSTYDFDPELEPYTLDLKEDGIDLSFIETDEDGQVTVAIPNPTQNAHRAGYLFLAAMDGVKKMGMTAQIIEDEYVVESTTHAAASGGEEQPARFTDTIEETNEHYLNLPYSRLVKDSKELLKMGGVPVEGEEDEMVEATVREWVTQIEVPEDDQHIDDRPEIDFEPEDDWEEVTEDE